MVLGAYEEHVLGPRRRAEARADKSEKKLEEIKAWNRRRLKAQADGEPYPDADPDAEPES